MKWWRIALAFTFVIGTSSFAYSQHENQVSASPQYVEDQPIGSDALRYFYGWRAKTRMPRDTPFKFLIQHILRCGHAEALLLTAFTDITGSDFANAAIAKARAESVRKQLFADPKGSTCESATVREPFAATIIFNGKHPAASAGQSDVERASQRYVQIQFSKTGCIGTPSDCIDSSIDAIFDQLSYNSWELLHFVDRYLLKNKKAPLVEIVTIPDPIASGLSREYDEYTMTIKDKYAQLQYREILYFSPWIEMQMKLEKLASNRDVDGNQLARIMSKAPPGYSVFENIDNPDDVRLVLYVGEHPQRGLSQWQMNIALKFSELMRTKGDNVLKVIGPSFSGSIPQLGRIVADHLHNANVKPTEVKLIATTATLKSNCRTLKRVLEDNSVTCSSPDDHQTMVCTIKVNAGPVKVPSVKISYVSSAKNDEDLICQATTFLENQYGIPAQNIILVTEVTPFGTALLRRASCDKQEEGNDKKTSPKVVQYSYDISSLRFRKKARSSEALGALRSEKERESLLFDDLLIDDLLPSHRSPLTSKLTLYALERQLKQAVKDYQEDRKPSALLVTGSSSADIMLVSALLTHEFPSSLVFALRHDPALLDRHFLDAIGRVGTIDFVRKDRSSGGAGDCSRGRDYWGSDTLRFALEHKPLENYHWQPCAVIGIASPIYSEVSVSDGGGASLLRWYAAALNWSQLYGPIWLFVSPALVLIAMYIPQSDRKSLIVTRSAMYLFGFCLLAAALLPIPLAGVKWFLPNAVLFCFAIIGVLWTTYSSTKDAGTVTPATLPANGVWASALTSIVNNDWLSCVAALVLWILLLVFNAENHWVWFVTLGGLYISWMWLLCLAVSVLLLKALLTHINMGGTLIDARAQRVLVCGVGVLLFFIGKVPEMAAFVMGIVSDKGIPDP